MSVDRRSWGTWMRRLGYLGGKPPSVPYTAQPVILVGDESKLAQPWEAPRGFSGSDQPAGAERGVWAIRGGAFGTYVSGRVSAGGLPAKFYLWLTATVVDLATVLPVVWGDQVGTTVVSFEDLADAVLVSPPFSVPYAGGVPIAPPLLLGGAQLAASFPEIWVPSGRTLLVIGDIGDEQQAFLALREAGDAA